MLNFIRKENRDRFLSDFLFWLGKWGNKETSIFETNRCDSFPTGQF